MIYYSLDLKCPSGLGVKVLVLKMVLTEGWEKLSKERPCWGLFRTLGHACENCGNPVSFQLPGHEVRILASAMVGCLLISLYVIHCPETYKMVSQISHCFLQGGYPRSSSEQWELGLGSR